MRLDMAITVAEFAAVHGYHPLAFEAVGLWEQLTPHSHPGRQSRLPGLPAAYLARPGARVHIASHSGVHGRSAETNA